jgi:hypothetical protein
MIIGVIVAIVVIVGVIVVAMEYDRRRKRAAYGSEFDALVEQEGSPRAADRELGRRRRAYAQLDLRPLGGEEHARYLEDWHGVQESFVDDPAAALSDAEALIVQLARFRGYPGGDGESLLELLSIPHTSDVAGYREAVRVRQATQEDPQHSSTEDMRQAFKKYAALFDAMLTDAGTGDGPRDTQSSNSRTTSTLEVGR